MCIDNINKIVLCIQKQIKFKINFSTCFSIVFTIINIKCRFNVLERVKRWTNVAYYTTDNILKMK